MTPAGIRQEYPIHHKHQHLRWSRKAIKALGYIITDRGQLPKELAKADLKEKMAAVTAGQRTLTQNAAHLLRCICPLVGDGKGRTEEEVWKTKSGARQ